MPVILIPLSRFLQQYDAALDCLGGYGVRTHGTRLAAYRRSMASAEQDEAHGWFDHQ